MLLAAAAFYGVVFVRHTVLFGDPMRGGFLNDVLGVGDAASIHRISPEDRHHGGVGRPRRPGVGFQSDRTILAVGALPMLCYSCFISRQEPRLVALVSVCLFWAGAGLWHRSETVNSACCLIAIVAAVASASHLFYERALQRRRNVDAVARTQFPNHSGNSGPEPRLRACRCGSEHGIRSQPNRIACCSGAALACSR